MAGTRKTPSSSSKPAGVTVEHEQGGPIELVTTVQGKRIVLVSIPANIARGLLED